MRSMRGTSRRTSAIGRGISAIDRGIGASPRGISGLATDRGSGRARGHVYASWFRALQALRPAMTFMNYEICEHDMNYEICRGHCDLSAIVIL